MSHSSLAHFFETYFRHRWLNLIPLFMMITAAAVWVVTTKPEYIAHGTMHVQMATLIATLTSDPQSQAGWGSVADTTTSEINALLQTDAFVRSVIKQSDWEPEMANGPRAVNQTLAKVRAAVWVEKLGPNMVSISARDTSPAVAQQLSAGIMHNYVQWRVNMEGDGASAQAYFEKLIPSYQASLNMARQELQTYLAQHPDPVRGERPTAEILQIDRLQSAVMDATTRLDDAVRKSQNAQLAGTRAVLNAQATYSIIDAPQIPAESATSRRKQLLSALVFIAAGVLLSAAAVVGAALFDTTLRFPADVQQKLGVPVLGAIPDAVSGPGMKQPQRAQAGELVAEAQGA